MTKTKERDGITKYHVNRHVSIFFSANCDLIDYHIGYFLKPIPLDLLTLANFTDAPQQRGTGLLRGLRGSERHAEGGMPGPMPAANNPETPIDSRTVFPCTIHHNGRLGGLYTLYAESAQARLEWKNKLEEALALRKAVTENNKVNSVYSLVDVVFTFNVRSLKSKL